MQQETTIEEAKKLDEVIQQSGLQIQESDEVKTNYMPFLDRLHQIKEQSAKINKENPTDIDEKIARELRLKTVKIRTDAEDVKDNRKKIHLLKGNLEQAAFNLIKADCQLIEQAFTQVEKAREIAEKKRKAELAEQRKIELQPLAEFVPVGIDLGNMDEENYAKLINGARLQLEAKEAEEKRLAEMRAERERIDLLSKERNEFLIKENLSQFIKIGDKNSGGFPSEMWDELVGNAIAAKATHDAEQERIRLENERLKKEAEEKEKALAAERAKVEAERKKQETARLAEQKKAEELLAKQKADADAKLKAEQEKARKEKEKADAERAKLEAELKAKKDAEEAEKKRIESEEKARIEAEKKLAKAGDKKRISIWIESLQLAHITTSEMKPESQAAYNEIVEKFEGFKKWAISKINDL